VVGGHSRAAAERAGRLGDGFFPGKGTPAELREMIDIVHQSAAKHDRDPSAIEVTAGSPATFGDDPVGAAEEMASVGVSRIMVPAFLLVKPSETDAMEAFAERVIRPTASIG
jgi:alkanesulfonate monooxygenase SsuD/methylene tetrahydromethanopterin reductase-like flavin-dependent oxidoreductase (luciferase family)